MQCRTSPFGWFSQPGTRSTWAGRVLTIAAHPTDPNTLYLGADRGGVWKSIDAGQSWSNVTPDLVYPAIRWLAIDPVNPDTVYAATTPSSYNSRFLRTTDAGRTWQTVPLTDAQGRATLLIDPDAAPRVVYAGTDFGVFRATDDGSGRWEGFNNGLPPVVVTRFAYSAVTRTLLAATYGRGVWAIGNLTAAQSHSSAGAAR